MFYIDCSIVLYWNAYISLVCVPLFWHLVSHFHAYPLSLSITHMYHNTQNINKLGSNKCTKRIPSNRRFCNIIHYSRLRFISINNFKYRRLPLPRIQIIPRAWITIILRRYTMVNLLGSIFLLFNYWGICWFLAVLDSVLLCI